VILPLGEIAAHLDLIARFGGRLAAEVPVLVFPGNEDRVIETLSALAARGLRCAVAENAGALKMIADAGLTPLGGAHLNVTNRPALRALYGLGCRDCTLSFELNLRQIGALRGPGKTGYLAWGRLPLMRFRACPMRGEKGCGNCPGRGEITDRKNERFPLLCTERRFSTLYNPVPLCAVGLDVPAADFRTFYFTVETPEECRAVTETLLAGQRPAGPLTAGQYNKKLL
jgi:putative protease